MAGLVAYGLGDFRMSAEHYGVIERFLPDHLGVVYNLAISFEELGQYGPAEMRLNRVLAKEPENSAALAHLKAVREKASRR